MKIHHRKFVVPGLILALVTAVTAAGAFAQGRMGRGPSPEARLDRLAQRLDLTADQKAAVEKVFASHDREMQQRSEDLRAAQDELHASIHADTFDESAVRSASAGVAAVEEEMAVGKAKMLKEMRGILTADQYSEFEKMGPPRDGRRAFRGRGAGPGPGPHAHRGWSDDTE